MNALEKIMDKVKNAALIILVAYSSLLTGICLTVYVQARQTAIVMEK